MHMTLNILQDCEETYCEFFQRNCEIPNTAEVYLCSRYGKPAVFEKTLMIIH